MRITELFTAKSIELDSAASNRDEILSRLVEQGELTLAGRCYRLPDKEN